MADIQYLNYGDQQVEQQALLNNLANQVQNYVANQSWSNKRKEKFMSAYLDIMDKGIKGATNTSGRWEIDVNGKVDLDSKSKKDQEMYQEAAYFIRQQMANLSAEKTKEEQKKSDLPVFNHTQFHSDLTKKIANEQFSLDSEFTTSQHWNPLDPRDSTGKRGRTKRAELLAKYLEDYANSLTEDKYNFKEGTFGSLDEFKKRIGETVTALRNGNDKDDAEALSRIGYQESDWFDNGLGDSSGKVDVNGNPLTYGDIIKSKQAIAEHEQATKEEKEKALIASRYSNSRRYKVQGIKGTPITNLEDLNYISSKLNSQQKLSEDEISKIVWASKQQQLQDLTREEFIKMPSQYRKPHRLKRIPGLEGIYIDSADGSLVQPFKGENKTTLSDIVQQNNPISQKKQLEEKNKRLRSEYQQRTSMTPQDWEYLSSIVPDIASIVDTEPISAGILAGTGAGMRHHALANRPGGMSLSDKWWQALDYAGAGLAAIPGFGDAYLIGRSFNTVRKVATGLLAVAGAYGVSSSVYNALKKTANGEDISLQEKLDILMAIPAIVSAYRLRSKEGLNEAAKAANQNTVKTEKGKVKLTLTDDAGNKTQKEITGLSKEKANELSKKFKEARNDNAKKEVILKGDADVQRLAGEQGIDLTKTSIETSSRYFSEHRTPTEIEMYPEYTPSSARMKFDEEVARLAASRNKLNQWKARDLKWRDIVYNKTGGAKGENKGNWISRAWHYITDTKNQDLAKRIKEEPAPTVTQKATPTTVETPTTSNRETQFDRAAINRYKRTVLNKDNKPANERFSNRAIQEGEFKIGNEEIMIIKEADGTYSLTSTSKKHELTKQTQEKVKETVAEILKEQRRTKNTTTGKIERKSLKEVGQILQQLKKKGWLKSGGVITDNQINDFLRRHK